jgi:AcrR family transcriptional regulator
MLAAVVRDAESTRRRLLAAAAQEFSARGIAGARVDRIAEVAGANKAMIYNYFGSKDQLFDAVFHENVVRAVNDVPIDPDDLPGYAGRLFDFHQGHPENLRLAIWHMLERGAEAVPDPVRTSNADKATVIADAQRDGRLPAHFAPDELLALVVGLSIIGIADVNPDDLAVRRRRKTITDAVAMLIEKGSTR